MPNGSEMLEEMNLEEQLKKFSDRELSEFTARQVYELSNICNLHERQIKILVGRDNKTFGLVGGASGILGSAIIAVLNYFTNR